MSEMKYEITEPPIIERSQPSNDDLFEQAKETLLQEKESETFWENLDIEKKEAIQIIMGKLLGWMGDNMNNWLPSTLKFENAAIDVKFRILMHEVDEVVSEQHLEEEIAKRHAMGELKEKLNQ